MSFSAPRSVHAGSDFWVRLGHLLSRHKWARFPRKEEPGIGLEEVTFHHSELAVPAREGRFGDGSQRIKWSTDHRFSFLRVFAFLYQLMGKKKTKQTNTFLWDYNLIQLPVCRRGASTWAWRSVGDMSGVIRKSPSARPATRR